MRDQAKTELVMYTTQDGLTKIEATFDEDTVWLSLEQMSELFQRDKSTISRHIKNIYTEGELRPDSTVAKFATVQIATNLKLTYDLFTRAFTERLEESLLWED